MNSFTTAEKIVVALVAVFIVFALSAGGYVILNKVDVKGAINKTIVTVKTSAGGKKDTMIKEMSKFKQQMIDSIAHKEKLEVVIKFDLNEHKLTPDDKQELQKILGFIKKHKDCEVFIYGYADVSGTDAINIPLSIKRTESVKAFLSESGIGDIQKVGYGSLKNDRIVEVTVVAK